MPSTEPAPAPRSALRYGVWAAVPIGLCAAWFTWFAPTAPADGAVKTAEGALVTEQSQPLPAAAAPSIEPSQPEPAAAVAVGEPAAAATPEAAAVAPAEPTPPASDDQVVAAAEPSAVAAGETASAATGESVEEASADVAAEDVEEPSEEVDASRKAALEKADKLISDANALRKKKKLGPARAKYREALAVYPAYPRAMAGLAQLSIQARDGKQAVSLAKQLVRMRPTQVSYQVLLGDAYKAAGKPGLAKEAWQAAARKGSATAKARLKG
jgi:hypothetical protein